MGKGKKKKFGEGTRASSYAANTVEKASREGKGFTGKCVLPECLHCGRDSEYGT